VSRVASSEEQKGFIDDLSENGLVSIIISEFLKYRGILDLSLLLQGTINNTLSLEQSVINEVAERSDRK
jgi:hypothetical protein